MNNSQKPSSLLLYFKTRYFSLPKARYEYSTVCSEDHRNFDKLIRSFLEFVNFYHFLEAALLYPGIFCSLFPEKLAFDMPLFEIKNSLVLYNNRTHMHCSFFRKFSDATLIWDHIKDHLPHVFWNLCISSSCSTYLIYKFWLSMSHFKFAHNSTQILQFLAFIIKSQVFRV